MRLLVLALATAALLGSSSGARANHVPDGNVDDIAHDLADFAGSLENLASDNLGSLAEKIPFTDVDPTGPDGLNVESIFQALEAQLDATTASSIADLEAFLNDPDGANGTANDGTLLGGTVDITGDITQNGSIYDIALGLDITRAGSTPINIEHDLVTIAGGTLTTGFDLDAALHFQFDPSAPTAEQKLYLITSESPALSLGFDADASFIGPSSFKIDLGIAELDVAGTADLGADFNAVINDLDGDGHITRAELTSAPEEVFTVSCGPASHATLDLDLTTDIAGLTGVSATVDLTETTPCDGVAAPTVVLGELGNFKNMSASDLLSSVAQLASMLNAVESVGPAGLELPFLDKRLAEVAKFNEKLLEFFEANGLSSAEDCATDADDDNDGFVNDGCPAVDAAETECDDAVDDDADTFVNDGCPVQANNPLDLDISEEELLSLDTIQEVIPAVEEALDLAAGGLGLNYNQTSNTLGFTVDVAESAPKVANVDFGDQLERLGIVDVDAASATADIEASYDLGFDVGLDLSLPSTAEDPIPLLDRIFMRTDGIGPEFTANAETNAELDLDARIGFLGIELAGNAVPLIGKRTGDTGAMLRIDLSDGGDGDGKLTFGEVMDGLIDDTTIADDLTPADIFENENDVLNVGVPETTVNATASVSGTELASGSLTFSWPDVLIGTPTLSSDTSFNNELLSFDFNHQDPLAMFSQVLDTLEAFVAAIEDRAGAANSPFAADLPIIGKSFNDLLAQLETIKDQIDALVTDPSATLQDLETELENLLGAALGVPAADRDDILEISAETSSPSAIIFELGLGVCSAENGGDSARCDAIEDLDVPFNVSLASGGPDSVLGFGGSGNLDVEFEAVANLNFGVQLPTVTQDDGDADAFPQVGGDPELFLLDTSGIDLEASVSEENLEVSAHVGPLDVSLGETTASAETACDDAVDDDEDGWVNDGCAAVDDPEPAEDCDDNLDAEEDGAADKVNDGCDAKGNPAVAKIAAEFSLANDVDDPGASRIDIFDATELGDYIDGLLPDPVDVNPSPGVVCPGMSAAAACARLPIFVTGDFVGVVTFSATDLLDFGTWTIDFPPDLLDRIAAEVLDWELLAEGLFEIIDQIEATLDGASYDVAIPGIGEALSAGADVAGAIGDFRDEVLGVIATLQAATEPSAIETALEDLTDDLEVTLLCGGATACNDTDHDAFDITDAQFDFSHTVADFSASPAFDIGFPGLRLRATDDPDTPENEAAVDIQGSFDINVGFGISKDEGFYLATANSPEVSIAAELNLPDSGDDEADLRGDLAFIRVDMEDTNDTDPDAEIGLSADITGGGGDGRLTLADLVGGVDPIGFSVKLEGGVHFHFDMETSVDIPGVDIDTEAGLPKLLSNFALDWDWGVGGGIGEDVESLANNDLDVSFGNVELDLGTFVDAFLGPIAEEVQRFLKPFQPVFDVISAPVPGIKQLAELVGAEPPTMIDLFEAASGADLTFVKRAIALISFLNAIDTSGETTIIDIGAFDLLPSVVRDRQLPANQSGQLIDTASESLTTSNVLSEFGDSGFQSAIDTATGDGEEGGFSFPAFQQPAQLFRLLVGQDVTLVEWRSGPLKAEFAFEAEFGPILVGPIPLSIAISLSAGIEGRFAIGYDTFGIRKAVEKLTDDDPDNNDAFEVIGVLFQGVFLDDLDHQGRDVPEITLFAEGAVGVAIDLVIVKAGVEGGIRATILMNLHDGLGDPPDPATLDGKLRIDEILSRIHNPICLFDVSGKLEAFIRAFVKIGFGPFSKKFSFTIVKITLVDLKNLTAFCFEPPKPVLAQIDGNVLRINAGPFADQRNINEDEEKEKFVVRQLRADGKKFSVSAFGYYQEFPEKGIADDPLTVFADMGTKNDSITLGPGPKGSNQGENGEVSDAPVPFTQSAIICGGPGNDKIFGADGSDQLQGDGAKGSGYTCNSDEIPATDGDDEINGAGSGDVIGGQGGRDEIAGDGGDDILNAGTGDDAITGGDGADSITGGPNSLTGDQTDVDEINGGPEPDVNDGSTDDTIFGGAGEDSVEAEAGEDEVHGGPSDDILIGSKYDDTIFGEAGHDILSGVEGDDELIGGSGDDDLLGDLGDDTLHGDLRPTDPLFLFISGDDDLIGGKDNGEAAGAGDVLRGGPGRDYLLGDEGTIDRPAGQSNATLVEHLTNTHVGNDELNGDGGNDVMFGQLGMDLMNGGTGDDDMHGNAGADTMNGNENADTMFGDPGTDTMHGNAGDDLMRGGDDNDTMHGDADEDEMYGDAGEDDMFGGTENDYMRGSVGNDEMQGNEHDDEMYGDADQDRMFGNAGMDEMFGNADFDYMEGNGDADTMSGGPADDDMMGGTSTAGSADAGDTMTGDAGTDTMAGDNAQITRVNPTYVVLLDVAFLGTGPTPGASGDDTMNGGDDEDLMYGQSGADTMHGNGADDRMEGNDGSDDMFGDADSDDMSGGSGRDDGGTDFSERLLDNVIDDGDTMNGGDAIDFMIGDNGRVLDHKVFLFNLPESGETAPDAALAGGDTMHGDGGEDVMYGQSENDTMNGNDADDYMEGNANSDLMHGNAGEDDMAGGSGHDDGPDGLGRTLETTVDDGDEMFGDDAVDFMGGDNATITQTSAREIELFNVPFADEPAPDEFLSGDDTMHGGAAEDVMYGQSDNDTMNGNTEDDYMEGNAGVDTMHGNEHQDDMLGGSGVDDGPAPAGERRELRNVRDVDDSMFGDEAVDYMGGDNALIKRAGATNHWDPDATAREVTLYDIQYVGNPSQPSAEVSGPDRMQGNAGNDVMFGEGNGAQDENSGDPADGVDNDRDGMEAGGVPSDPTQYDCNDGADNDADGATDGADAQCAAARDENNPWDGDKIEGGTGDDYMEGNHGADWMLGQAAEDDMIGGSSEGTDGVWGAGSSTPTELLDRRDVIEGEEEDDALIGDNGHFDRPTGSPWKRQTGGNGFDLVERVATMAQTPEQGGAFGRDYMRGGDGHDDMYGGQAGDYMEGNGHEDAMVGDLGLITNNVLQGDPGDPAEQFIDINPPFIEDTIFEEGSLYRETELYSDQTGEGAEGDDIMLGGDGNDSMHGNAGNDFMNGNGPHNPANANSLDSADGEDHLFGGDGADRLWGGRGHDHLFGGHGNDYHDVVPRPYEDINGEEVHGDLAPDPPLSRELARAGAGSPVDNLQGRDYTYGGFDKDAHQANVGRPGPRPGDRLIDWVGNTNIFFTCPGAYGEGVITRMHSPDMQDFLQHLALGDGAVQTTDSASSGFRELALIFPGEESGNPVFPTTPGHFTCPPAEPALAASAISLSSESITAGDQVTINANVTNLADEAAAGAVVVRFAVNGVEIGRQTVDGIDETGTETASQVWNTRNLHGPQQIEVMLDPDDAITDEDVMNNAANLDASVQGTDAAIAPADVTLSRAKIVAGDKVDVTATVRNPSSAPAYDVVVKFTDNDAEIGSRTIAQIAPGGNASATVRWRTNKLSGAHTVAATADPANAIAEVDESNNAAGVVANVIANRVKNGVFEPMSLETPTTPEAWTGSGTSTTYVLVEDDWTVGSASSSSFWISDWIPVTPGATYDLGIDAWGGMGVIALKQYSSTDKAVSTTSFVLQPSAGARLESTNVVTINSKAAKVRLMVYGGLDGRASLFTTAQLSDATTATATR